ncbi:hypothetical protein [Pseudovibrio flavus]|uniref:hypothetical protein n=1 Tax=Pseudovibrio flavus TaxID=2529854 RepID=UPI00211C08C0|nr:hypothetical protein [Pseudovibrio flavus]
MTQVSRVSPAAYAVPEAVRDAVCHLQQELTAAYLLDCLLLQKGISARILPVHQGEKAPFLASEERAERFAHLLQLWTGGCHSVVDEQLYEDAICRRPQEYLALRQQFRRVPLSVRRAR